MTCLCRWLGTQRPAQPKPANDPCASKCGACSQCTRSRAAWRNKRLTGAFDFPGGAVEKW